MANEPDRARPGDTSGLVGPHGWRRAAGYALLFAVQFVAARFGGGFDSVATVSQAIAWLATGVGIAGLWLLGLGAAWVVGAAAAAHRLLAGYYAEAVVIESLGSAAEAVVGVLLLRRFGLRPELARLRDAFAMLAVAVLAPLVSMLFSFLGRSIPATNMHQLGFLSGWVGWWRMNALGALTVVPMVLTWRVWLLAPRRWRAAGEVLAVAAGALLLLAVVTFAMVPSPTGITLLHGVFAVAMVAALWQGPVGATTVAAAGAAFVAIVTMRGDGPFQCVPYAERHVAAQVYLLGLVGVPLVFGALSAERSAHVQRWLRSEGARRALLTVLPDATLRLDPAGRVREGFVPPGQSLLLPGPVTIGALLTDTCDGTLGERFAAAIGRAAAGERPPPIDYDLATAGGERACEARCVPIAGGDVLVVVRDVTSRRDLELRLRHAQKLEAVGKLAGGVAHDFNNLLTVVAGNAELLRHAAAGTDETQARAGEIVEAAERGASLTRQLLAFSRQQVLQPTTLECGAVVAQLVALLRRLLGADIALEVGGGEPAWVHADRSQVEQVVMNLAVNARDAMPAGGTLRIATTVVEFAARAAGAVDLPPGRYAELLVQDDGVGMSEAVRARAFEPFFTTKGPGRGTGLGLATVHGIVHQSGGAVAIESAPGRGTLVRVWLPAVAGRAAEPTVPSVAPARTTAGAILVVEDERAVRDLIDRQLTRAGYRVVTAEDGTVALARFADAGPFDLLVTDLVMPRLGGFELARRLRLQQPDLPVLIVSAHAEDPGEPGALRFAGGEFLAKPFARDELLAKVADLLARRVP